MKTIKAFKVRVNYSQVELIGKKDQKLFSGGRRWCVAECRSIDGETAYVSDPSVCLWNFCPK